MKQSTFSLICSLFVKVEKLIKIMLLAIAFFLFLIWYWSTGEYIVLQESQTSCPLFNWRFSLGPTFYFFCLYPLSVNPTKWSNTLKQVVGKSRRIVWECSAILRSWKKSIYSLLITTLNENGYIPLLKILGIIWIWKFG